MSDKMTRTQIDCYLEDFVNRMRAKLYQNEHKGGWLTTDLGWMLDKLDEEVAELKSEIGKWDGWEVGKPGKDRFLTDILHEAADVANIAMMIHDICHYRMPDSWYSAPKKARRG